MPARRANLAAVNYHFGDKEGLYAEVLRYAQQKAFEKYPLLPNVGADASPTDKLRAFVHSFLLPNLRQRTDGVVWKNDVAGND